VENGSLITVWWFLCEVMKNVFSKIFCLGGKNQYHTSKKNMDWTLIKDEDTLCPCLWVFKECFLWLVSKMYGLIQRILCLKGLVVYFYDSITDILMLLKLLKNCHYNYAYASMTILSLTFLTSMRSLGVLLVGNAMCFSILFMYPVYLIFMVFKKIFYGSNALTEKEELALFKIRFTETIIESVPELGLSLYILHHHGLDHEDYTFFQGDLQVASIVGSVISILKNISAKHAYFDCEYRHIAVINMKDNFVHPEKNERIPSFTKVLKSLIYNAIPILGGIVALFIMMSKNKYLVRFFFIAIIPPLLKCILHTLYFISQYLLGMLRICFLFCLAALLFLPYLMILFISIFHKTLLASLRKWGIQINQRIANTNRKIISMIAKISTYFPGITMNHLLVYICMLTSILHTIQFSTETLPYFQEANISPFNSNSTTCAALNSSDIPIKKNIVDENSLVFMVIIWIFSILGCLQLFLENNPLTFECLKEFETRQIELQLFVEGPFMQELPRIYYGPQQWINDRKDQESEVSDDHHSSITVPI